MSQQGIDAYRVASVLGYCLLPMVGVGTVSVLVALEYVQVTSFSSLSLSLKQWNIRILALYPIHTMVYVLCFWDFRSSASYVGPTAPHCLSDRFIVRMFCSP